MRGQLLVSNTNFENVSGDYLDIYINNVISKRFYLTSYNLYSCPLSVGDVVRFEFSDSGFANLLILNLVRRDYTTDDEGGNNGIVDTNIATNVPYLSYTFTATTVNSAYDFEYRVENTSVYPTPFPTATPSPTPEPSPTPSPSPSSSPTPSPTASGTPTPTPTMTGTATPTPTMTGTPTPTPTLPPTGTCYNLTTVFTGSTYNGLNDVIQTNDYSYILAGTASGMTYGGTSIGSYVKLNNNSGLTINGGFTLDTSNDWQNVEKIVQLSNGKYVVAGRSTSGKNLIQLNSDGTVDTGFTQNTFNSYIRDIAVQTDGKIIAGGAFTTINGSTYERYVRLNTNGTIDTSFYSGGTGTGFSGSTYGVTQLYGITIQSDNNILLYGDFASYSGTPTIDIIRLTSTGSVDNTFSGSTTFSGFFTAEVISAVLYTSTNKILVRGWFRRTSLLGQDIIMLNNDGTWDSTFIVGTGIVNTDDLIPRCKPVELSDGSFMIGSLVKNFTPNPVYNGSQIRGIFKVSSTGSISGTYGGTWSISPVDANNRYLNFTKILVDANGNYVVVYNYTSVGGGTSSVVDYNNPATTLTNGGYAILDNTGVLKKC